MKQPDQALDRRAGSAGSLITLSFGVLVVTPDGPSCNCEFCPISPLMGTHQAAGSIAGMMR
jgi:hypothetical protein